MKILIAEDDRSLRMSLRTAVRRAGHEPVVVGDGESPVDVVTTNSIRFVISDWEAEGLNGLELCRAIRRQEGSPYIYMLLLVDDQSPHEMLEGLWAGADDFLTKPLNEPELTARLRNGERTLAADSNETLVFALAKLAEMRDPCMDQHLERLQRYCLRIAESLLAESHYVNQLDPKFIRLLYQTSALHDIGKVIIPDAILLKPGQLNEEEFSVVKTHSLAGAHILDAVIKRFPEDTLLQFARDVVLAHHERWDGYGYPYRLAGEDIPLAARIVALADLYDALTSKRVYRNAISHAAAREVIASESGSQLDPAVVAAFQRASAEFLEIRWQYHHGTAA
jgi:putative two-component system response regulator